MKRRKLLVVVVLLLGAGLAGAFGRISWQRNRPTDVRIYDPAGAIATEERDGSCFAGSVAAERSDAWRCAIGNGIHDPCFETVAGMNEVVCADGPWGKSAFKLNLTEPLPVAYGNHDSGTVGRPWALELVGGARCVALTGTVEIVGGITLEYGCTSGDAGGGLDRHRKQWRVLVRSGKTSLERVAVRTAWF